MKEPKPPHFKQEWMDITFLKDAIHQEEGMIRLSIPKQLKKYLKENGHYLSIDLGITNTFACPETIPKKIKLRGESYP